MKNLILFIITALLITCSINHNLEQNTLRDDNNSYSTRISSNDKLLIQPESEVFTIKRIPPNYPESAEESKIEGEVFLKVEILANGTVGKILIIQSLADAFDKEAVEAVKQWKFSPLKKDGKPVACWVTFPILFELK
ncbi:MAG: energy transducer TonB [Candidatus Cloacimonetes bacterium]|jgi:protein TonB|nr:energy transducer TonB [Candidatus Cloacimonadota bacterium]